MRETNYILICKTSGFCGTISTLPERDTPNLGQSYLATLVKFKTIRLLMFCLVVKNFIRYDRISIKQQKLFSEKLVTRL
jgi:hypothetical protein